MMEEKANYINLDFNFKAESVEDDLQSNEEPRADPLLLPEVSLNCPSDGTIVEIVEGSKRTSRVFIDEMNYAYLQNKKRKMGGFILRCYSVGCSGTGVHIPETSEFHRLTKHCHVPNIASVLDKWRFLSKVKERAENEDTKLKTIYEEEALTFNSIDLPTFEKIKSSMRKRRHRALQPDKPQMEGVEVNAFCNKGLMTHYLSAKMETIEGPKRYSKIYIDDLHYCYQINRKRHDGGIFLRCHKDGCRGSAIYNSHDGTYEKLAKHSHYADPQLVLKWRFLHIIKKRAEGESTPLRVIYGEESIRFKNCDLPPFKKIESTLQKRRKDYASKEMKGVELREREWKEKEKVMANVEADPVQKTGTTLPKANNQSLVKVIKFNCKKMKLVGGLKEYIGHDSMPLVKSAIRTDPRVVFTHEAPPDLVPVQPEKTKRKTKSADICPKAKKRRKKKSRTFGKKYNGKLKIKRGYRKQSTPKILSKYCSKMEIIEGKKRFSKMFIDEASFIYQLNKVRQNGSFILKCHAVGCRSSGFYFPKASTFQRLAEHNHPPDVTQVQQWKILCRIKSRAELEPTPLRAIYEDEISKHPGIKLMSFERMVSTLQKRRRSKYPSEPHSIQEARKQLETFFSHEYGKIFYRRHLITPERDSEMLVFVSSGDFEDEFRKCSSAHFDISFKVLPQAFEQILIIHLVIEDHAFPVVYALLTKVSESAYLCLLNYLADEFPSFSPSTITTDYEFILEKALQTAFPHAIINGCWFYYTQSVWRRSQLSGLAQVFYKDEYAKSLLKSIMALPLLPASAIPSGVTYLLLKCEENSFCLRETRDRVLSVINYVQDQWIRRIGIHRLSVFKLGKRLSYDIEALYHLFIKKFGIETPSFIKFIEKLYQFESVILSDFLTKKKGCRIRYDKSRRCSENEKKIQCVEEKMYCNSITVPEFLETIFTVVPTFYHHEFSDQIDDKMVHQDPSDIPESFQFCEISVNAPEDEERKVINVEVLQHDTIHYPVIEKLCKLESGPVYVWKDDFVKGECSLPDESLIHPHNGEHHTLLNTLTVHAVPNPQIREEFHASSHKFIPRNHASSSLNNEPLNNYPDTISSQPTTSISLSLSSNTECVSGQDAFTSVQNSSQTFQGFSNPLSNKSDHISLPVETSLQVKTISSLDDKVLIFL